MVDPEERVRRDAVRRVLGGDPVAKVARELARSEAWVRKWLERFDPAGDSWAVSASRAPRTSPGATEAELVALVLKVRSRLAENPWGQVGAAAIAWELSKLGVENPPPQRTIERILARAGTTRRTRREADRRPPKGKDYPAPCAQAPNALQQIDWIGPRYLEGGQMLYVLNTVDLARHKVAREEMGAKSSSAIVEALTSIWGRLGVPVRAQFDNQQALAGSGLHLGQVVRFCLVQGVIPVFVPFSEPWRQGVVEHYNDTFDKRFFRTERFPDVSTLAARMADFEDFHNAQHRYSALGGATPDEVEARARFKPRALKKRSTSKLTGTVEYIRFIRSDAKLHVLSAELPMPESLVYEYLTAVLTVETQQLAVHHHGEVVLTVPFPLSP